MFIFVTLDLLMGHYYIIDLINFLNKTKLKLFSNIFVGFFHVNQIIVHKFVDNKVYFILNTGTCSKFKIQIQN